MNTNTKSFLPGLLLIVVLAIFMGFYGMKDGNDILVIETVKAQDVYPWFMCPCCGKSINTACCGMAKERKAFVDGLTSVDITADDVITAYVSRYGLSSFRDEIKKEEYRQKLVEQAPDDRPIIVITPSTKDLGDVSQKKGTMSTYFELKNDGETDLIINNIETSCGCTSASITYNGKEGPVFSMPGHGVNEKIGEWEIVIPKGEKAQVTVYYDPNMHGDLRGSVIREVHIFSNDPIDSDKKVSIELNQVE